MSAPTTEPCHRRPRCWRLGDATGFDAVIRALGSRGFSTVGFANPLRDLASDAALLTTLLRSLAGPIAPGRAYLRRGGHHQRGNRQRSVQALVYLNGWMPDEGESIPKPVESDIFSGTLIAGTVRRCLPATRTEAKVSTCTSTRTASPKRSPGTSTPRRPP